MADRIQVTQPDAEKREALVAFRDGSKATVSSGVSSGRSDNVSSVDVTYTYGPYKGSTVRMSFDFDLEGKYKPGEISIRVSGNYPSARVSGEQIAELLRNPTYLQVVGARGAYDLTQSGRELAARVEEKLGITAGPTTKRLAPIAP